MFTIAKVKAKAEAKIILVTDDRFLWRIATIAPLATAISGMPSTPKRRAPHLR